MSSKEAEVTPTIQADKTDKSDKVTEAATIITTSKPSTENLKDILSQLNLSDKMKKLLLESGSTLSADGLEGIATSSELIIQVKTSLEAIIDSIASNPSLIGRLTQWWGSLSWTEKVIGGFLISIPAGAAGLASNIGFLWAFTSISATYSVSGYVLEDNHTNTKRTIENLKKGVVGIVDVLVSIIKALDIVREKLAHEVERFKEQNEKLIGTVTTLADEVDSLKQQTGSYLQTERFLRQTQAELEITAAELKKDLEKNQQQYTKTIAELTHTKQAHAKIQEKLSKEVELLAAKKGELQEALEKSQTQTNNLQATVKALSGAVIADTAQRKVFEERLKDFIKDKDKSFSEVAQSMSQTDADLRKLKVQFDESLKQQQALIKEQAQVIEQLKTLTTLAREPTATRDNKLGNAEIMKNIGLLAAPAVPQKAAPSKGEIKIADATQSAAAPVSA